MKTEGVHPATTRLLERLDASRTLPLLLYGPEGSDLARVAAGIAEARSRNPADRLTLQPDKKSSITIEQTRELRRLLNLRLPERTSRTVVIEPAELMTNEAQNALLKILEEPPERTLFVLCAGRIERLLTTVRSRCFALRVLPTRGKEADSVYQQEAAGLLGNNAFAALVTAQRLAHDDQLDIDELGTALLQHLRSSRDYERIQAVLLFLQQMQNRASIKNSLFALATGVR